MSSEADGGALTRRRHTTNGCHVTPGFVLTAKPARCLTEPTGLWASEYGSPLRQLAPQVRQSVRGTLVIV